MDQSEEEADYRHDELLQQLLITLLTNESLPNLCANADLPVLRNHAGQPVQIRRAASYRDAGVLTLDHGLLISLSDGSAFGLTITISHLPDPPATP